MKSKMLALIYLIAECHETEISEARAAMIEMDLSGIDVEEINSAWRKYRSNPANRKMPTAAELLNLLSDGHVSAQEAWAMMPRDDHQSVVWTEEMRMAYSIAAPLIAEKNINGAFFAFKEAYEKLVSESKFSRKKPQWSPSFGYDKNSRELALIKAVEKKRISVEEAISFYPELEYSPNYQNILLNYNSAKNTNMLENKNKLSLLPQLKTIK